MVVLTILTLAAALLPLTAQAVTLKEGTRSQGVEALQQALKSKGYFSATSTGYYGDITVAAVKSYQKDKKNICIYLVRYSRLCDSIELTIIQQRCFKDIFQNYPNRKRCGKYGENCNVEVCS